MPPKDKNKTRVFYRTSTNTVPSSQILDPPLPFERVSPTLEPFVSKLDKSYVYITHLDTHPAAFKRKIFAVPLLMNIAIVVLIIWRIKTIGPYYTKLAQSIFGYHNETSVDTQNTAVPDLVHEVFRRASIFIFDLCIYVLVWPGPRSFFFGLPANPTGWRLSIGFQDTEIIVRRSRQWDREIGDVVKAGAEGEDGGKLFLDNVRAAVGPVWLAKTGYLLMNRFWDLDWKAMIKAHQLVKQNTAPREAFQTNILVHSPEFGWVSFEALPKNAAGGDKELSAREEASRKKIMALKDELTAIGKENLFFRWVELIQYESSQPGGFGPERQAVAMRKAKEMFEEQGVVDFDQFWGKIGGVSNLPGFDEP